jgi:DNA-binding transcriptional ArsR family regulator
MKITEMRKSGYNLANSGLTGNPCSLELEDNLNSPTKSVKDDSPIDPRRMAVAASKASELMKTLGHKDRLMVLCHLSSGEKSVGELARLLDIPQSPLSQHLARMRKEKLVTTRREAQTIYYAIASQEAARMVQLMHEIYCSDDDLRLAG